MLNLLSKLTAILFISSNFCHAIAYEDVNIDTFGETKYTKATFVQPNSTIIPNQSTKIYEPFHKKWSIAINNILVSDYDHFGNQFKTNVFTTLSVDF